MNLILQVSIARLHCSHLFSFVLAEKVEIEIKKLVIDFYGKPCFALYFIKIEIKRQRNTFFSHWNPQNFSIKKHFQLIIFIQNRIYWKQSSISICFKEKKFKNTMKERRKYGNLKNVKSFLHFYSVFTKCHFYLIAPFWLYTKFLFIPLHSCLFVSLFSLPFFIN